MWISYQLLILHSLHQSQIASPFKQELTPYNTFEKLEYPVYSQCVFFSWIMHELAYNTNCIC